MIALREAATRAFLERLADQIPEAVVERARRSPVDLDAEPLPRLIVMISSMSADETVEAGRTHYRLALDVTGYAVAATDEELDAALSDLHARVVAALGLWEPAAFGIGDAQQIEAQFSLIDAADAARPVGEFAAVFQVLAVAPIGVAVAS